MTDNNSPRARDVLWGFGPMVYGPTALFALGEGAIVPLLPVIAANLGADIAMAGFVASCLVVGQLTGNIPAGWTVRRWGERTAMVIASLIAILGAVGLAFSASLWLFALCVFAIGLGTATFGLARQAFMTIRVPLAFRARALSLLGGAFRLGMFVGPFVTAGLLRAFGDPVAAVAFFLVCLVLTLLLVLLGPDPEQQFSAIPSANAAGTRSHSDSVGAKPAGVFRTIWQHRRVLGTLGLAAASLSAVRSARQIVLPLWGVSIALDAQTISLVVGVAGAIDFALFYASGQVMDRFGRLWAALPAMVLMGAGFVALSFTHDGNQAALWFGLFAAMIGVGNGLSSGILLTLGADVAPAEDPRRSWEPGARWPTRVRRPPRCWCRA